ncbi:DUF983 domain-containing protein [Acidiphilium sp. AL]|uniref:DUF983 domain-containing protein n=1 Tax=Acidiphilium iwatense TaxID=768198 RepID=A0ABS9DWN2_9PROT|nr:MULTISPECIES: DUF983 domain-containing protein [Acidiphilium]MCF3946548.1 DUF983 domain-containing protein [Acidiphilium iwatense]MCU4160271.1 DUF983 domain-containing protein [Acidiphilium sp. AL]
MPEQPPHRWTRRTTQQSRVFAMPGWSAALARGLAMRCPSCGQASAFAGWFTIRARCPRCDAPLGQVPCDTLPPYLTIVIGLGIIGGGLMIADRNGALSYATSLIVFIPLAIVLQLLLQRPVKGVVLALMMKNDMIRRPVEKP